MTDAIHPRWEAVDEKGEVQGTWHEKRGTYQDADWIRKCRDMYFPGHRLRVVEMVPVVRWDGEGHPGILVLPPDMVANPEPLRMQVFTTSGDHPDPPSEGQGLAPADDPWPGLDN